MTPDRVHYGQADAIHAARPRYRVPKKSRALRQKAAATARKTNRRLDQSADQNSK
jgi:hypothetical protein